MSGYRRDFAHGLMFHRFGAADDALRPQGALTPGEFDRILQFVGIENILSPAEWMSRAAAGALEPRHVCVTFDDGLRSQFDHALPILDRYRLKAFWFVYSCVAQGQPVKSEIYSHVASRFGGFAEFSGQVLRRAPREWLAQLESPAYAAYAAHTRSAAPFYSESDLQYRFLRNRPETRAAFEALVDQLLEERGFRLDTVASELWLADAQLKYLAQHAHAVGLHSYDHPYAIAQLPVQEQRAQYEKNRAHITVATGQPPCSMSHPLNSYNDQTLAILQDLGISCGFRANMQASSAGINPTPLEFARQDAADLRRMVAECPLG